MTDKYQVRNEEIETKLKLLGSMIGTQLPKGYGFTLQIFDFGEGGANFYISNAQREDMIKMMKEFVEKHEKGEI